MVTECLADEQGAGNIPCHQTLDGNKAICRGFWDGYRDKQYLLTLAERMGVVEEVSP